MNVAGPSPLKGAMRFIASVLVVSGCWSASLSSQQPNASASIPGVEVASIRVVENAGLQPWRIEFRPDGGVTTTALSLRMIIQYAYDIDEREARFTLLGGPEKILAARFDVIAVPSPGGPAPSREQARQMLQSILAARFKLRLRTESRQAPTYSLVVSNANSGLRRSAHDCRVIIAAIRDKRAIEEPRDTTGIPLCSRPMSGSPGATTIRGAGPIEVLRAQLQGHVDRPIVDETRLAGNFEWTVGPYTLNPLSSETPSIYTAIQEQAGLRLVPDTGPVRVFVVESVDMPTPN
jgi:uncharacterized protein (TIGR03435 family)